MASWQKNAFYGYSQWSIGSDIMSYIEFGQCIVTKCSISCIQDIWNSTKYCFIDHTCFILQGHAVYWGLLNLSLKLLYILNMIF